MPGRRQSPSSRDFGDRFRGVRASSPGLASSKLDQVHLLNVATWPEIDVLVTDGDPANRTILAAQAAGVQVVLAERPH